MFERWVAEALAEKSAGCNRIEWLVYLPSAVKRLKIFIPPCDYSVLHIAFQHIRIQDNDNADNDRNQAEGKPFAAYFAEIKHGNGNGAYQNHTRQVAAGDNKTGIRNYQRAAQHDYGQRLIENGVFEASVHRSGEPWL